MFRAMQIPCGIQVVKIAVFSKDMLVVASVSVTALVLVVNKVLEWVAAIIRMEAVVEI